MRFGTHCDGSPAFQLGAGHDRGVHLADVPADVRVRVDAEVAKERREVDVDAVVEYRISKRVKEQFEAFMSGFSELIPQDLITVFDERELELLIGGMSEIDVYVPSLLLVISC